MSLIDDMLAEIDGMSEKGVADLHKAFKAQKLIWFPTPGPQLEACECLADELFYGGEAGGGKALSLNTQLPTPSGWTSMGEVQLGDELFDENGKVCRVIACSPVMIGRPCFRLEFSDGTEIVADADHQWLTMTQDERDTELRSSEEWRAKRRASRKSRAKAVSQKPWVSLSVTKVNQKRVHKYRLPSTGNIRTTAEIAGSLTRNGGGANHSVAVAAAIDPVERELPIDPYLLGLWVGDGSSYKAEITTADPEIIESINAIGFDTKQRGVYAHGIYGLLPKLRAEKLLANKHIPAAYLRASHAQRLALLQGWMDTDGHVAAGGQCELTTVKLNLAEDAQELIASLGIKCTIQVGKATLYGKDCGPKYRLKFTTDREVFRLCRKASKQRLTGFRATVKRRYIERVEPIASVPVRCVAVDSPKRLFLASEAFIPTHNSDLVIGLSLTRHKQSLVLRRTNKEASKFFDRYLSILGSKDGWNGQHNVWRLPDGRVIDTGGCQYENDKQGYKGQARDLYGFDEIGDFLESQFRFIIGWNRSVDPKQRCRVVCTGNPPTTPEGLWVIKYWAPWLDETHPSPAKPGELRWYTTVAGKDEEVDGPGPHLIGGEWIRAKSRTFIRARLSDNPYLGDDYAARLAALPEPLRSAYKDGRFDISMKDADWQAIPTAWILAAQARWKPDGWKDFTMTAMGYDPAGGGKDSAELCWRHGGWYGEFVSAKGEETADGSVSAAYIIKHRRDAAPVVVDVGGGYGGAVTLRLKDNKIDYASFNGAGQSTVKSKDGTLQFANKRAEAWWKFREELDPDQYGGSAIALPPDPELRADLAAPSYTVTARGIQIEPKEALRQRLGRSPGKGDACVMAFAEGNTAVRRAITRSQNKSLPTHAKMRSGPLDRRRGHSESNGFRS